VTTIIYGFHPVREVLRHRPRDVEKILVANGRSGGRRIVIERLCKRHGIELAAVSEDELCAIATGGVHNGVIAQVREGTPIDQSQGDADLVVLVEDIQDPRNLGALMRVCEGAGVGELLVRDRGSTRMSGTVTKTAAGAAQWLPTERITNAANEIQRLKDEGFWVYGADAEGDPVWDVDLTGKVAFAIGGEERGLRARTKTLCDRLVSLPMAGKVQSLNLATAACALLYEAVRQRTTGDPDG